jgi:hypothetical protein
MITTSSKIDMADMVDMGEIYDHSPSEVISKQEEQKPHYPDIYGLNVTKLPAIQDAKVGSEVILVAKVKVRSLEVRENDKGKKKATATVDIMEACAYPVSEEIKSNNKDASDEDLPQKPSGSAVDMVMEDQMEEDD